VHNITALPPIAPPSPMKKKVYQNEQKRIYNDNVILINPLIDCSDKELHQRNGFLTTNKLLVSFLKNGDKAVHV
jgi:hypothetical protein